MLGAERDSARLEIGKENGRSASTKNHKENQKKMYPQITQITRIKGKKRGEEKKEKTL